MCDEIATSDEHIPPKCIFPEAKDLGIDYRKNLIKVPSCDTHNLQKSKDDEYLMMVLTCSITNNKTAMDQINTKIIRAWRKIPSLAKLLLNNTKPVVANGQATLASQVDITRFNSSLDCIARGLYYDQYKKKWSEKININSPAMLSLNGKDASIHNQIQNKMGSAVNQTLVDLPKYGENQDVFWCQLLHNKPEELLINMMFFGGFQVLAFSKFGMDS